MYISHSLQSGSQGTSLRSVYGS